MNNKMLKGVLASIQEKLTIRIFQEPELLVSYLADFAPAMKKERIVIRCLYSNELFYNVWISKTLQYSPDLPEVIISEISEILDLKETDITEILCALADILGISINEQDIRKWPTPKNNNLPPSGNSGISELTKFVTISIICIRAKDRQLIERHTVNIQYGTSQYIEAPVIDGYTVKGKAGETVYVSDNGDAISDVFFSYKEQKSKLSIILGLIAILAVFIIIIAQATGMGKGTGGSVGVETPKPIRTVTPKPTTEPKPTKTATPKPQKTPTPAPKKENGFCVDGTTQTPKPTPKPTVKPTATPKNTATPIVIPTSTPNPYASVRGKRITITSIGYQKGKGVQLTWQNMGFGVSYKVYRRWAKRDSFGLVDNVGGALSYVDTYPFKNGYMYFYYVEATDHSGNTIKSYERDIKLE